MQRFERIRTVMDRLLVLLFVTALFLPLVGLTLQLDVMPELIENRRLAQRPSLPKNLEMIADFPGKFTAYFNDNFGFRPTLIRWQGLLKLKLFRATSPDVIVGKHDWLFLVTEYSAQGQRLIPPFTDEELEHWERTLKGRRDWLARRGIHYLFAISPNKESIYKEYLPTSLPHGDQSRLDQLLTHMNDSDIKILDLRPALHEAKSRHEVYYKTDAHWNFNGSLAGYQAIITELRKSFPRLQPISEADCTVVNRERTGNLMHLLGLGDYLKEISSDLVVREPAFTILRNEPITLLENPLYTRVTERKGSELPRLVMFHDSAGRFLTPYFPQNFSRAVFVYLPKLDPVLIESERPTIVIQVVGEWMLAAQPVDLAEIEILESGGKGKAAIRVNSDSVDAAP